MISMEVKRSKISFYEGLIFAFLFKRIKANKLKQDNTFCYQFSTLKTSGIQENIFSSVFHMKVCIFIGKNQRL